MAQTAYEAVYIVEAGLAEDAVRAIVDKYRTIIENGGGTIDDVDIWETRKLAYPLRKGGGRVYREGVYVVKNFLSNVETKNELDRIFRISDDVLRYMIVKQDEKADRYPSKARAAEAEKREREASARAAAQASNVDTAPVTDLPSTTENDDSATASEE